MAATAWMTSDQLVEAIKRKISIPIAQNTYSSNDILAFTNEELLIAQVPALLEHHEEYFVTYQVVPLRANVNRYAIPKRAIGDKLRDIFYSDNAEIVGLDYGNLFEMTRLDPADKAFFQATMTASEALPSFYMEGGYVVLSPNVGSAPTGKLVMYYFLRPNQLVSNDRAAIAEYFVKTMVVSNSTIAAGDTVTIGDIEFEAVASGASGTQFNIGATSIDTASNLATVIQSEGTYIASNGVVSSATVTVKYTEMDTDFETSNTVGFAISDDQGIEFDEIPENIANGSKIDFLQTDGSHKTYEFDVRLGNSAISGDIITFGEGVVPDSFEIGDYICTSGECIIPQIPSDLHNGLAERASARILAAIGDSQGLQITNSKISDIVSAERTMISNRVEGAPLKVNNIHSILQNSKIRSWGS